MDNFFCTMCNEVMNEETCWTEFHCEDIIPHDEIEEIEEEDIPNINLFENKTEYPSALCEQCYNNYFHGIYCYISGQYWNDFHPGLTEAEEMWNDGICPICDEYNGLKADWVHAQRENREPTGYCCQGHGMLEWREYHDKVRE